MSRQIDPASIKDEDREYLAQFEKGRELVTAADSSAAEDVREAFLKAQTDQERVSKAEVEKAALVTEPASTGVVPSPSVADAKPAEKPAPAKAAAPSKA